MTNEIKELWNIVEAIQFALDGFGSLGGTEPTEKAAGQFAALPFRKANGPACRPMYQTTNTMQ